MLRFSVPVIAFGAFGAFGAFAALATLAGCQEDTLHAGAPVPLDGGGSVCTTCGACEQSFIVASSAHVTGMIDYPDYPPPGGPHNPCWAPWGVHQDVVATENWVHNTEHGGIVYLYPVGDAGTASVVELAAFVARSPRTLLTAAPELTTAFAAVAWGHRLVSPCVDEAAAEAFYAEHLDHGPESIPDEPPSSCR
jgi:hypothetical protein